KEERRKLRIEIVRIVADILKEWKIFIKPHPLLKISTEVRSLFTSISEQIVITEPEEPTDVYIEVADLIIDLPRSASTTVYTALIQSQQTPILSIDIDGEFCGDGYKNFNGIEYISSKENFINTLELIKNGKYTKMKCDVIMSRSNKYIYPDIGKLFQALL
ncbi:MAG TPA: hypothetical protein VMW89_17525, partial [Desulfatiglandales bacterium]|nr:hypothetical protein [Desulfatiglandales bacterium]